MQYQQLGAILPGQSNRFVEGASRSFGVIRSVKNSAKVRRHPFPPEKPDYAEA
jgi:hypothetical protein